MTETKSASDIIRAKREQRLPALAVSRGIGIGKIVFLHGERRRYFRLDLDTEQIEAELERFKAALKTSTLQLRAISSDTASDSRQSASGIFGVHLLILESSFAEKIETFIKKEHVNAEWAIKTISDQYVERQTRVTETDFRDKYLDIEDVSTRLLNALDKFQETIHTHSDSVIAARDLTPSAIMELVKNKPSALITEQGGWTSHSSILARELNLPMVSGVRNLEHYMLAGDRVVVDGINGEVILNPSDETVAGFQALPVAHSQSGISGSSRAESLMTMDGTRFVLRANVDQPETYQTAKNRGARGIGLYRSETLIRQPGAIPSEDQQFEAYKNIADASGEQGVKIRTFDVGIDRFGSAPHWIERNPSLGLRAIRLSLADPTHFRTQLRAILRAAFGKKIDIILPMISGADEIVRAKMILDSERADLIKAGIDIGDPQLGAMIETPSAVLTAFEIAKHVDFLCLGTNDLVQYLLAVDRDNDAVADWYQTLHPAVIRAISNVLVAAQNAGVPVTVCGEMAGSPFYVSVLLGIGVRDFSMNVNSIQAVRRLLSGISLSDAVALVVNISKFLTAEEAENYLREYYFKHWAALFPADFLDSRFR